ncbi:NADH-quinone oxidoreductase subunit C [Streptomyces sp. ID05-39B]|uniref:NADH-quinone oxidoreductase subunit C n=1 Tax=Streptomyces sp. ID05-39B TaxID=3028664 RepID=UPI0029B58E94|nr:NADH-quinone oxidoreductase subunit C [Streptomyces sp. ID05-39B]MDX3530716.1 NADH-quinone oxidoreductase subunit C [Streptomyces sp. ID05-39B]
MTTVGWLPAPAGELFGPEATAEESYEVLTVDVPPQSWTAALLTARDRLSCTYFDWLSAVDEAGTGFRVCAHVVALTPVRRLLVRTTVPHEAPTLDSAVEVYAGAAWHERETHEMFGVVFANHPALDHLLLPETFEGHPLRKDFVLAARVAKAWPGAKEPGESEHGGPKRRQMLPPGVPDPNEWGPLKGQLPPAPARATRAPRTPPGDRPTRTPVDRPVGTAGDRPVRTPGDRPTGDHPVRRARTASEGSAGQAPDQPADQAPDQQVSQATDRPVSQAPDRSAGENAGRPATTAEAPPSATTSRSTAGTAAPRRSRSVSQGSASQRAEATTPEAPSPEAPSREASPQKAAPPKDSKAAPPKAAPAEDPKVAPPADPAAQPPAGPRGGSERSVDRPPATPGGASRSADAPWHHARPAFEDPERDTDHPEPERPATTQQPASDDSAPENDPPDTASSDNDTPANPQGGPQ